MLPVRQPADLCSIGALSRDIYFTSLFPQLYDKDRVCLAATCRSQLALFHRFSLDFIKVIGNNDLTALQEALSKNSLENQIRVIPILLKLGFFWNREVSFESNVYENFPQYRKASSLYLSASGRDYLISLGMSYSRRVKMGCSDLTLDSALESVKIAKEKIAKVCEGGKAALFEIINSDMGFKSDHWVHDSFLENATIQIQKNKALQKYIICGEINLYTVVHWCSMGRRFDRLENPFLQHALDTGKISLHSFFGLRFYQTLVLRLCQNREWCLLTELIETDRFYIGSDKIIRRTLNDEWVINGILSHKIELQEIKACCRSVVVVYLNSAGERIALRSSIDLLLRDEWRVLDQKEYSLLNFKPIQQAIDQGGLSLREVNTMTLDELNKKVPDFYKETFFERANDVASKMSSRIQSGISDALVACYKAWRP